MNVLWVYFFSIKKNKKISIYFIYISIYIKLYNNKLLLQIIIKNNYLVIYKILCIYIK